MDNQSLINELLKLKAKRNKFILYTIISFLFTILGAYLYSINDVFVILTLLIVVLFIVMLSILISYVTKMSSINSKLTNNIRQEFFKEKLGNFSFSDFNGLSFSEFKKSDYTLNFRDFNPRVDFDSSSTLVGTYNKIPFQVSNVEIKETVQKGKNTTIETVFDGLFLSIDLEHDNEKDLFVMQDGEGSRQHSLKLVEVEDVDFNDSFNIRAAKELDAFVVLTPPTIEKLKNLSDYTYGGLYLYFKNDKMYICLNRSLQLFRYSFDLKNQSSLKEGLENDFNELLVFLDVLTTI